jgi:hypothetical protein
MHATGALGDSVVYNRVVFVAPIIDAHAKRNAAYGSLPKWGDYLNTLSLRSWIYNEPFPAWYDLVLRGWHLRFFSSYYFSLNADADA